MIIYVVLETNFNSTRPIAVYYDEARATTHAAVLGFTHDGDAVGSVKRMELI